VTICAAHGSIQAKQDPIVIASINSFFIGPSNQPAAHSNGSRRVQLSELVASWRLRPSPLPRSS
jgi:hypothetical protein